MNISLDILGERLRSMRKQLGVRQEDIAQDLGVHQNVISRLEGGKGGSIENLLLLTNYFSGFFYLDNLFCEHFIPIELSNIPDKIKIESVAIERLEMFRSAVDDEIKTIIGLLER